MGQIIGSGTCHHSNLGPQVADGVKVSYIDGNCEYIEQAVVYS